jgi:hypothetical protein
LNYTVRFEQNKTIRGRRKEEEGRRKRKKEEEGGRRRKKEEEGRGRRRRKKEEEGGRRTKPNQEAYDRAELNYTVRFEQNKTAEDVLLSSRYLGLSFYYQLFIILPAVAVGTFFFEISSFFKYFGLSF